MPDNHTEHAKALETLARSDAAALKQCAEQLLENVDDIEVVENRTGLVMLPLRDTVKGTAFHLGEVLMSEAHIRMLGETGYGMRTGRDLQAALAMAVVDAAWQAGYQSAAVTAFLETQAGMIAAADDDRLRDVEATRVNMETF